MRTYISPIGYDTRRVTRPVVNAGLSGEDTVQLLRPEQESDTERATQAVADVQQLLQEIEPTSECVVTRISTDSFEETVRECCAVITDIPREHRVIVSLGGGARDILLPLTVASLVFGQRIDQALFFSDLDSNVCEWSLPVLNTQVPSRTFETFEVIVEADDWISLTDIATATEQSKSTVIRHVHDLEDAGIVQSDTSEKAKRVRIAFSGELFWMAQTMNP